LTKQSRDVQEGASNEELPETIGPGARRGYPCGAAPRAQELSGTLKKIKDTGSITIGHRDASIPFSYYDDKQQPVGFALDICNQVVDAIKTELKLARLTSSTRW